MAAEHVVMVVVNDVVNDSRVLREAAWLARAGLAVTVLGVASGPARDVVAVDRVLVARLPLSHEISAARSRGLARRRAWRPLPAALGDAEQRRVTDEVEQLMRPGRELAEQDAGRASRLLRRAGRVAHRQAVRAAEGLDGVMVQGWAAYDRWRSTDDRLVRWQSVVGGPVADYEATFGPVLDELAPDVVHAHDVHVLGVAVHAARRAARRGRPLRVVYDAHEFVPGMAVAGRRTARSNAGWRGFEERYVRHADAVVTVGEGIADLVQRAHDLPERPAVVLNVPVATSAAGDRDGRPLADVRADCGLAADVPLLVYSGTLSAVRGVDTAVRALPELPEAHLAVVCVPRASGPLVDGLREQARALGCQDRLHLLPPVGPGDVVRYLATADVGLITMHGGWPNHENAMPNKFFEYLRAGVPLVVTDLECLGGEVRSGGLGATFPSADPVGLAVAVREVLADLPAVRARVAASGWRVEGDWRVQEVRLREVYERLLGRELAGVPDGPVAELDDLETDVTARGRPLDPRPLCLDERPAAVPRPRPPLLLLGPADLHGCARALARAVRAQVPGLRVEVSAINPADPLGVDRPVRRTVYHRSLGWQLSELRHVLADASYVLVEDGGPLAGSATGGTALRELTYLTGVGARCGVLLHSPPHDALRAQLDDLVGLGVALLVSDPGLVGAVPAARWLPLVLPEEVRRAQEHLAARVPGPHRTGAPVVAADALGRTLLRPAVEAGRVRLHDGPVDDLGVPTAPERADAFVLGSAGPGGRTAVRAMACGLPVVAGTDGPGPWLPLVGADGTPGWRRLDARLENRQDLAARAAAGPEWVLRQHAGPASVEVLRETLGLADAAGGTGRDDAVSARSKG